MDGLTIRHSQILGIQGEREVLMFLNRVASRVDVTVSSAFLQQVWGDFTITKHGQDCGIELKAEQSNRWGNLFLETWSNREWRTLGWLFKLRGDYLFYYFVEQQELWTMPIPALQDWAFGVGDGQGHIWTYPEKKQSKYDQKNDSWGRCVPIVTLQKALGNDIKLFRLD